MTTPCIYEGKCRIDCERRGDDCDGNAVLNSLMEDGYCDW